MKRGQKHNSLNFAVSITLFTVFALFLTLVLLMGASSFRSVSASADERYYERTPLLYITQKIRMSDRADSIRLEEIDGVSTLVLTEYYTDDSDEFFVMSGEIAVYIYYRDGYINEFLTFDGEKPNLSIGVEILPVESLDFEMLSPSLIKITIDGKSVFVNINSDNRAEVGT
ncbi:MAG: DUF4860 domain-containing protein [Oscillospiraceae bacterium]|nr:DUF4860 domain-containing protein [Oscillospiraceae bacterium]